MGKTNEERTRSKIVSKQHRLGVLRLSKKRLDPRKVEEHRQIRYQIAEAEILLDALERGSLQP